MSLRFIIFFIALPLLFLLMTIKGAKSSNRIQMMVGVVLLIAIIICDYLTFILKIG